MGNAQMHVEASLAEMEAHAERFTEYVDCVYNRSNKEKLNELASLRRFSAQTLARQQVFYVPKSAASLIMPKFEDDLKGFGVISVRNKPVFYDRWLFPIRNSRGKVINLVGYSAVAKERYLFGKATYYDRRNTLFGLENLALVSELGYAIITEGITDAIRLRDIGFSNAFAMCGTGSSTFIYSQINRRAEKGVICFPDRDEPGQKALKGWDFNNRFVVWTDPKYKDIDQMCRENPNSIKTLNKALQRIIENLGTGMLSGSAITLRAPA